MPLYYLYCKKCDKKIAKIMEPQQYALGPHKCANCDMALERVAGSVGASVMESLDNGAMPRRVERFADAERLHRERNANADERAGR